MNNTISTCLYNRAGRGVGVLGIKHNISKANSQYKINMMTNPIKMST
jgi:hypothetical protein